jgi:hypothetical protein
VTNNEIQSYAPLKSKRKGPALEAAVSELRWKEALDSHFVAGDWQG